MIVLASYVLPQVCRALCIVVNFSASSARLSFCRRCWLEPALKRLTAFTNTATTVPFPRGRVTRDQKETDAVSSALSGTFGNQPPTARGSNRVTEISFLFFCSILNPEVPFIHVDNGGPCRAFDTTKSSKLRLLPPARTCVFVSLAMFATDGTPTMGWRDGQGTSPGRG